MEKLRITLAAARVNAGLTQDQVRREMGITTNTIVSWENGQSEPKVSQALKLAELYKIPIDNIIFLPIKSK